MPLALRALATILIDTEHTIEKPADLIVVLAGDSGERVEKAAQLYHEHKAPLILMTGNAMYNTSVPELMKEKAIALKVPSSAILLECQSQSTLDHPKNCRPIFKEKNIKSIIIVTSKYHTARSYRTFLNELKNDNIHISIDSANDGVNYRSWWTDHESTEKILIELGKTVWYALE